MHNEDGTVVLEFENTCGNAVTGGIDLLVSSIATSTFNIRRSLVRRLYLPAWQLDNRAVTFTTVMSSVFLAPIMGIAAS
ncbi:hypothetical protein MPER_12054 [Moniliophthora perniciosa FA553]|nr:hypothetical protein MPER_12054 [Moniliophthora perniciosa FA553]